MTYFEELGGEAPLLAIIGEFVDRVCADTMIGFLFAGVDRQRLKRMEYEHAAAFLGAPVVYSGRPIYAAHARHPIMGGHFGRRRQILKNTLEKRAVPEHIRDAWLAHQDALRGEVTKDQLGECTGKTDEKSEAER
jgi:hemoglobin